MEHDLFKPDDRYFQCEGCDHRMHVASSAPDDLVPKCNASLDLPAPRECSHAGAPMAPISFADFVQHEVV